MTTHEVRLDTGLDVKLKSPMVGNRFLTLKPPAYVELAAQIASRLAHLPSVQSHSTARKLAAMTPATAMHGLAGYHDVNYRHVLQFPPK